MMKNKLLLLVSVVISLAVNDRQALAQDVRSQTEVGRYQLVASFDGRIVVLDTATGQCWSRTPGGNWRDEGNPTQTDKTTQKTDTTHKLPQLELPSRTVEMTIIQREERAIPGSDGSVRLRLGDITEGHVFLTAVTADGEILLKRTSVAQGDKVEFVVGKKKYVLDIKQLRNILIGDDFATVTITEADENSSQNKQPSRDQKR
ncbi:hypothetical protein [Gimesia sp.]|uniref:hypothetical protein n=1 Tax=Gimesia sp. TaxID=2024833 RepID=UPI003A8F8B0D